MRTDLETSLKLKYPKLITIDTTIDDGWFALVDELCERIQKFIDENNLPQVRAVQIKEKFGGLRFYLDRRSDHNTPRDSRLYEFIADAEIRSLETCEVCGAPGKLCVSKPGAWIRTLCEEHSVEHLKNPWWQNNI